MFWQSRWAEFYKDIKRLGVLGGEMESSIVLLLSRLWGLRGASMAVCLDNILSTEGCLVYFGMWWSGCDATK